MSRRHVKQVDFSPAGMLRQELFDKGLMREYRLDVRMPRELSAKLDRMVAEFKSKGVKTSKGEVVVTILKQFFERSEDG